MKQGIKKLIAVTLFIVFFGGIFPPSVFGMEGEIGYFGGISEGYRLPQTIDQKVVTKSKKSKTIELNYKEVVFITGKPIEMEGTLSIQSKGRVDDDVDNGIYDEVYTIKMENPLAKEESLERKITFETRYYKVKQDHMTQVIKDSTPKKWTETVRINGKQYTLDSDKSRFIKSMIEDYTPGVQYYSGKLSTEAHYINGDERVIVSLEGPLYGYEQPWSKTETQDLQFVVKSQGGEKSWEMAGTITPSVITKKTLKYYQTPNLPHSLEGTYEEIMENHGGLLYTITSRHPDLSPKQKKGSLSVPSFNIFEILKAPKNLDFLKGHFAEEDIKKLYSMNILDENPAYFKPNQAMPRSQYVKALCRAMNIPIEEIETKKTSRKSKEQVQPQIFADVSPNHPEYPYIMAAYKAQLIQGDGAYFYPERPITREEAFVIFVRILGLERLGLDPTPRTPFVDDAYIAPWAKRDLYAAYNLGLIKGNPEGKILPKNWLSKAEAAALTNRLIDYLRSDMLRDYRALQY